MLRNEIAHEYTNRQLSTLFADILAYTPTVLDLAKKKQNTAINILQNKY